VGGTSREKPEISPKRCFTREINDQPGRRGEAKKLGIRFKDPPCFTKEKKTLVERWGAAQLAG